MRIPRSLALATVLLSMIAVPARAQAPERAYVARPAPNAQKSATNDYFVIEARPGTKVEQSLEIENTSDDPIRLTLNPVDAATKDQGGVKYEQASESTDAVGSWIEVSRSEIELPAGDDTRVRFTVRVPKDAREGVNLGALVLQDPDTVDVDSAVPNRTVIAVQVNTPGRREAEILITGVRVVPRDDAMYLEVGISNEGSAFANGSGSLRLPDEVFESQIEFGTFVPGTAIDYPLRWTTDPEPGPYAGEVVIEYGSRGQTAEWSGTIDVSAGAVSQLNRLRGTEDAEGSDDLGILPLVAGIGVIALIAVAAILGRRRKSGPVTVPAAEIETPTTVAVDPQPVVDRPTDRHGVTEAVAPGAEGEGEPETPDAGAQKTSGKTPAQKTVKKTTVRKTAAKKTAAKKSGTKKSAAKKKGTKKSAVKRTAPKKSTGERSPGEPGAPDPGSES